MQAIPSERKAFAALVRGFFLPPELGGVTIRDLDPPGGRGLTVVYIDGMLDAAVLDRLLWQRLIRPLPDLSPDQLARSGHFAAPVLRVAGDASTLSDSLSAGMAAIFVEGHCAVLLLGDGATDQAQTDFRHGLAGNLALLRREVRHPGLRVEFLPGGSGGRTAIAYIEGVAVPSTVAAVRNWAWHLSPGRPSLSGWQALLQGLRVPQSLEQPAPAATADHVRRGYVAVLTDHLPHALLAPCTLELLLGGVHDVALPLPIRRMAAWPRILAAALALTLTALFVAATSYHHGVLPGPFLVALASGRQNLPFPIVMEAIIIELLDDLMYAGASRLGLERAGYLAVIGTVLAAMALVQSGVMAPAVGMVGVAASAIRQVLPHPALVRLVRVGRFLFIGAAAALGLYGMAIALFALMAYLAEERTFGHLIRRPAAVRS